MNSITAAYKDWAVIFFFPFHLKLCVFELILTFEWYQFFHMCEALLAVLQKYDLSLDC